MCIIYRAGESSDRIRNRSVVCDADYLMIISRKSWLISKSWLKALKEARIANDAKAESSENVP